MKDKITINEDGLYVDDKNEVIGLPNTLRYNAMRELCDVEEYKANPIQAIRSLLPLELIEVTIKSVHGGDKCTKVKVIGVEPRNNVHSPIEYVLESQDSNVGIYRHNSLCGMFTHNQLAEFNTKAMLELYNEQQKEIHDLTVKTKFALELFHGINITPPTTKTPGGGHRDSAWVLYGDMHDDSVPPRGMYSEGKTTYVEDKQRYLFNVGDAWWYGPVTKESK